MKILNFKNISLFFGIIILALSSCTKPDPDAQSAEDDARGNSYMMDAFALGNDEAGGGGEGKAALPDCMTVDRDTLNKTVTITFDNCSYRGVIRNGIIHVSYSIPDLLHPRAVSLSITFDNYTFDGITVEGTIVSTFGGTILRPEIAITAQNMKATFTDDRTITWSSDMTYTITEGFGDGIVDNNVIEISGTSEGTNRQGKTYESVYNAVTIDRACEYEYPISGTVTITSDKGTTVINYGDGTCDNVIEASNNGVSITILL